MACNRSDASPLPRLILIADRFTDDAIAEKTLDAVDAGVRWVHLRDHRADAENFEEAAPRLANRLREISPEVMLSINRRLETAIQAGLHFHTSARGPAIKEARRQLPGSSLIGYSAHSIKEGQRAAAEGADYVFFSPVFPTSSKPGHPGAGVAALQAFCEALAPVPVYALGGITLDQAKTCLNAGAYGIAVLSAILRVDTPSASTKSVLDELSKDESGVRREEEGEEEEEGETRDERPETRDQKTA